MTQICLYFNRNGLKIQEKTAYLKAVLKILLIKSKLCFMNNQGLLWKKLVLLTFARNQS